MNSTSSLLKVQQYYDKLITNLSNPLGLTEELVENLPPATEYTGSKHIGRVIAPRSCVNYVQSSQPRDKQNDIAHLNDLKNDFEVYNIRLDKLPPVVKFANDTTNPYLLEGIAGWHRDIVLDDLGQEFYVYDVYEFETPWDERLARSSTNWSIGPQKTQTRNDYLKEICNAVQACEISNDPDAISDAVEQIASDRSPKVRRWIKSEAISKNQAIANFRTYNPEGKSENSILAFCKDTNIPIAGVNNREIEALMAQGCITYFATNANNFATWGRGFAFSQKYDLPILFFGYLSERKSDLREQRLALLEEFQEVKDLFVKGSFAVSGTENQGEPHYFPIRFAGFLPQNIQPSSIFGGIGTENTIVDVDGNPLVFSPDMMCLTEI
jgi:hypothetical protein